MADIYAPIRTGSDIAFLGGLIRYVIENNRYFNEYVVNYTNAATIIADEFQDTEDLDGVFSGLMQYTGDPINGFVAQYDNQSLAVPWRRGGGPGPLRELRPSPASKSVRSGRRGQPGAQQPGTPANQPSQQGNQTGGAPATPPASRTRRWSARCSSRRRRPTRRSRTRAASSRSSGGTSRATPRRWSSG